MPYHLGVELARVRGGRRGWKMAFYLVGRLLLRLYPVLKFVLGQK